MRLVTSIGNLPPSAYQVRQARRWAELPDHPDHPDWVTLHPWNDRHRNEVHSWPSFQQSRFETRLHLSLSFRPHIGYIRPIKNASVRKNKRPSQLRAATVNFTPTRIIMGYTSAYVYTICTIECVRKNSSTNVLIMRVLFSKALPSWNISVVINFNSQAVVWKSEHNLNSTLQLLSSILEPPITRKTLVLSKLSSCFESSNLDNFWL